MRKSRGEIVAIKDLFGKYRHKLIAPQKTVELEVIRVVGELTGLVLKESQVVYTVSSRVININAPTIVKQEIKLKQEQLLKELKSRLGAKNAPVNLF